MTHIVRSPVAGLVVGLACARGATDDSPRVLASVPGDSVGWRAVSVPELGLRLQYPESRVRGVVDRSTRECRRVPQVPGTPWDSAGADTLVIATAPLGFDSLALAMGFEVQGGRYGGVVDTLGGAAWTLVDSLRIGPWQALTALAETKVYFDDMQYEPKPGDAPDARMMPDDVWQERFVAAAAGPPGCMVVLAWRGRVERASKEADEAGKWPRELLQAFLERATILPKPAGGASRQ